MRFAHSGQKCQRGSLAKLNIIDIGTPYDLLCFAREVDGADSNEIEDALLRTGDRYFMVDFAETIGDADIRKIRHRMVELEDSNNPSGYVEIIDDIYKSWNVSISRPKP